MRRVGWIAGALFLLAGFACGASLALLARTNTENANIRALTTSVRAAREQLTELREQLSTQQTEMATLRKPATQGHLGVCFSQGYDNTSGDVLYVDVSSPSDSGGVPSCPSGAFISVVPGNTGH